MTEGHDGERDDKHKRCSKTQVSPPVTFGDSPCCGAQNFDAALALVVPSVQWAPSCPLNGALP